MALIANKLIQGIVVLAALSVILFTILQLKQHGYDAPSYSEHLIVNVNKNGEAPAIDERFNQLNVQLQQQKSVIYDLKNRLHAVEQSNNINRGGNENYSCPTNVIYENPLNNKQCQNAILAVENIDVDKLIKQHTPHIPCTKTQTWRPHIWTREGIGSLMNRRCYKPRTPIRTTNDYMNVIKENNSLSAKQNGMDIPVYYHMPKCASSSTAGMLSEHFDFKQQWVEGPDSNHAPVHTKCGFTFVRNPIERFISGYYTINNMLYRDLKDEHGKKTFSNHTNEKYANYKFIRIIGEPERFETYIDEMFADPYTFGKHTGSQMYFLSNWYGSDIQFFGRVERYKDHWNELLEFEGCKWLKQSTDKEIEVVNSMYHYGHYGPTLWRKSNGEKKEYVDALGMRRNLELMYGGNEEDRVDPNEILAPAYYFMTEQIFDKIIHYFWQDFVCFGYPTSWQNFQKYVAGFVQP